MANPSEFTTVMQQIRKSGDCAGPGRPRILLRAYIDDRRIPQTPGVPSYAVASFDVDADGVPRNPGILCAMGLLLSDLRTHLSAGRMLPLGSIAAGLNGLGWIAFALLYVQATWKLPHRSLPIRLWDWAVVLMLLAAGGAFGVAALVVTGVQDPRLHQAFLHLFLDLFGFGWFGLAMLGVLWVAVLPAGGWRGDLPVAALAVALLPTFILGMAPQVVTPPMFWTAALANLVAAWYWSRHLYAFWQLRGQLPWLVRVAGIGLGLHLAIGVLMVWPGLWQWSAATQLRVFFLHNWLLGTVSSALMGVLLWEGSAAMRRWLAPTMPVFTVGWAVGVAVMVAALALVGLAGLVPVSALISLKVAAWASVLPALVAIGASLAVPVAQRIR